jgi:hypothetical protein
MAVKQSMKPRTIAKKPTATGKRGIATRTTDTAKAPAAKVAKATTRKTKATAVKAAKATTTRKTKAVNPKVTRKAKAPTTRKTKATATKTPRFAKTAAAAGGNPALNGQGQDLMQQAIQTQAWMTNEIAELRAQLAQTNRSSSSNSELEQLRQENADLREKASRLDQMTYLLQGQPVAKATRKSPTAKAPRMPKATKVKTIKAARKSSPKVATPRKAKAAPVAKVSTRKAATKAVSVTPTARKTRSGVSILQDAAAKDVNRTFKSCWPIVFKIEEWNQKHPNQLAKVSQTMLNKSGVNFSRAKGFMDNYGELVESYHQQIGLSKANSGKFNEVYEFIRSALGKGKKA